MIMLRQAAAVLVVALFAGFVPVTAAGADKAATRAAMTDWYRLILELVRHTPTYSPPVASRSLAYVGIAAFQSLATGSDHLISLSGQLNDLGETPPRERAAIYDDTVVLHAAMARVALDLFSNTGPTGQRALKAMERRMRERVSAGLPEDVIARSQDYGLRVADHVLTWSRQDGGAKVVNMGFPLDHRLGTDKSSWVPTSLVRQQQMPLLPRWGENRTFAMPDGASCPLPAPPAYSENPDSEFYKEADEVFTVTQALTPDQSAIARFWSDDPMLSPTPPGHWIAIALQIIERDGLDLETSVDTMTRLSIATADAFIGCWHAKFEFDLLRPVTYIHRVIDPVWEPLLTTPPFPEYPSGHSTLSAAAATVLTSILGENVAFEDKTHERDGLPNRHFASFNAAAEEAGISRLYGGIHFRSAIERGLEQGRCIGAFAASLRTRK